MRAFCYAAALALADVSVAVDASSMQFLVMGDWGGSPHSPYTTGSEVITAGSMDAAAKSLGAKFALALGDNFYTHGVTSVSDPRFAKTFEQCFTGAHLQSTAGFKFHVLAGNHDHYGSVQAQVDYSAKSERWNFPSLWYEFTETAPDGATIQFVMVDTPTLAGNSQWNAEDTDPLTGFQLPGPVNISHAQSQLDFIKRTLASSTADFLIVAGHYPVFSIAEHGPTKQLQPGVFPYLRQNKVSAYFCGHEHNAQYIDVGDDIQYHVIGSAHEGDKSTAHAHTLKKEQVKFHGNTQGGGFASVEVSKSGMQIKHYDGHGTLVYTAPMVAPRSHSPSPPTPPAPPPTPPSPPSPGSWECHANHKVSVGTDTNLKGTGSDITSCEKRCRAMKFCKAALWHKTDKHCHIFTGSFSHDEFISKLTKDDTHDSCFFVPDLNDVVV